MATRKRTSRTVKPAKQFFAKVKGADEWLGYNGTAFEIVTDQEKATRFTEAYVKKIAASKWGKKTWEKQEAK